MPEVDRELAHAKLTRTLHVTGVRDDGYHLLESEMVSLDLADELEIEAGDDLSVAEAIAWVGDEKAQTSVHTVPADESNLVRRALSLTGRTAKVRLVKHIPAGAGLGGGSSDGAAMLRWAGVTDPAIAVQIGADVPFCVRGGRARVRGVGEVLDPLPFEELHFVVVTPALGLSTAAVYATWDSLGGPEGESGNDLEPAAIKVEPLLAWWRELLGGVTGEVPILAGSGSSWFAECGTRNRALSFEAALVDAIGRAGERAMVRACGAVASVSAVS